MIFTDVDVSGDTRIDFFDGNGNLIHGQAVLPSGGDELFSFLGITVDSSAISRVRITAGSATIVSNGVLGTTGDPGDLVAMDDFLYAEPVRVTAVPEPAGLTLGGLALLYAMLCRRRNGSVLRRSRAD